ncbi:hypothetical protein [Hymenobacter crusticola]|uniref:Uncharacterized protein n=1 Tax=Hymenobacter crusticola TaxID=1770526 RepID=A0A243W8V7_9BACT|nr:hypothetical protein [Hymenobacter crusticola]OUJ71819.1 hypothetical protein BXP70_20935 [Hymenobacter crusticola]
MNAEIVIDLAKIFFDKGVLAMALLVAGYIVTKSIEKIKSNEAFRNEINKKRVERISKFYDLFSEYEHWVNRLANHFYCKLEENKVYLTAEEFDEAKKKSDEIGKTIGFELNQMRFWINDDIYYHTVAQLELFKKISIEVLLNNNFERIKEYRLELDTIRMNIDKLAMYLKQDQNLKLMKYDRKFMYK